MNRINLSFIVKLISIILYLSSSAIVNISAKEPPARKPNIIIFSIDTLRADHLSCYGYTIKTSPYIDQFVKDAVIFKKAFSQSPITAPSHMSLFTALTPPVHGVNNIFAKGLKHCLAENIKTIPQMLKENGYITVGNHGGGQVTGEMGFSRGFDEYVDGFGRWESLSGKKIASLKGLETVTNHIQKWVRTSTDKKKPIFLFLHHYLCHDPYIKGPEKYRKRFLTIKVKNLPLAGNLRGNYSEFGDNSFFWDQIDLTDPKHKRHIVSLYDGGVLYSDYVFKRLLDTLKKEKMYDDSLIILLSDHGEEFNEHGGKLHGKLWIEHIHVPLLIKFPDNIYAESVIETSVRIMDIMPTICEFLKIPISHPIQGLSFMPLVTKQGNYTPLIASYGTYRGHEVIKDYMVRILKDNYVFIDFSNPFKKLINVYNFSNKHSDNYGKEPALTPLPSHPSHLEQADQYFEEDNFEKACEIYKIIIRLSPDNGDALLRLATCYREMNRHEDAVLILGEALKNDQDNYHLHLELGRCHLDRKDYKEAEKLFKKAQKLASHDHRGYYEEGRSCRLQGRMAEAKELYERAIQRAPEKSALYLALARLHKDQKKPEAAGDRYMEALSKNPQAQWIFIEFANYYRDIGWVEKLEKVCRQLIKQHPHQLWVYYSLGGYYEALDCIEEAEEVYKHLGKNNPEDTGACFLLGNLYLKHGQLNKAKSILKKGLAADPDNANLYLSLGALYREKGNYPVAEQNFKKAGIMGADESQVCLELGKLYHEEGQFRKAVKMYDQARSANPGLSWKNNNCSLFNSENDEREQDNLFFMADKIKTMYALADKVREENEHFLSLLKKGPEKQFKPDDSLLRQLKALGYAN